MKNKDINYSEICNLFRKVITALVCIEYNCSDKDVVKETKCFLKNFIKQYEIYSLKLNSNLIDFKYSEKDVVEFACSLYDNVDVFRFAEELEFGFSELVKNILLEREKKNEC